MKRDLPRLSYYGRMKKLARVALAALVCSACAMGARAESHRAEAQQAQSVRRNVTGVVTDNQGKPLAGANVTVVGVAGVGAVTDAQGRYSLTVARGARLSFSFVGYADRQVAVADQTTINVTLHSTVVTAETAVVTGIFNKPRESYTGAASMITGEQLLEAGGGNLVAGLRNLDPTFYVAEDVLNGSDPNALPMVTMRGATTLPTTVDDLTSQNMAQSNLPLVVLDNFEVPFSRLVDIDQNMVESITLLKDASATSIYGTRGANGVIVIVTKRPKAGRLQLTYNGRSDIQFADLGSYNLMNASEKLEYERLAGMYVWDGEIQRAHLEPLYNSRKLEVMRGVNTDWMHYPIRVGIGQSHSMRAEGGEETFRYAINASYKNVAGVMKNSNRQTVNGGMNFIYTVKKLVFQNDLQIYNTHEQGSNYGGFAQYTELNPYFKPYSDAGDLQKILDPEQYGNTGISVPNQDVNVKNPLWDAAQPQRDTRNDFSVTNNFMAEWRVSPDFFVRGSFAFTVGRNRADRFKSSDMQEFDGAEYQGENAKYKGSYMLTQGQRTSMNGQLTANYNKIFNDVHQLYAGLSGQLNQSNNQSYWQTGYGISDPDNGFYGSAHLFRDTERPSGYDNLMRSMRLAATVNYTYNSRYYVDLSGSYNGSSTFGSNNRFAPIWSVGAGWNLHRENWFSAHWVDYARVRASYGLTGSDNFQPNLSQVMFQDSGSLYDLWGGSQMMGIGNPDLKWQQTYQWNVGGEMNLMENRFNVDFNIYNRRTKNLIANVSLPPAAGYTTFASNMGEVENKGFDLRLNVMVLQNRARKFQWNVGVTAMHNENKILKISDALKKMNEDLMKAQQENITTANYKRVTAPMLQFVEGYSQNTIWAVPSLGIDPMTGREILVSKDGERYFASQWRPEDRVACGTTDPKISGAFNTQLRYGGWRLSAFFYYSLGGKTYNQALANKVESATPWLNGDKRAFYDRWSAVGQNTQFKAINDLSVTKSTSRFVMKNNYFTFSKVTLGFEVPTDWSQRVLGMQYLTATAEMGDVFHIASTKRERGTAYPFARTVSVSLTARF